MALVSKPDHTRHTMTRTPVSKADMPWPTVASHLASNANRHSIKAAFEESTHQRLEGIGAQSLREMWQPKMQPKRRRGCEGTWGGESKPQPKGTDSTLPVLV
jgi:hypothetical protein